MSPLQSRDFVLRLANTLAVGQRLAPGHGVLRTSAKAIVLIVFGVWISGGIRLETVGTRLMTNVEGGVELNREQQAEPSPVRQKSPYPTR
jgi:hypothetical protein